MPMKIVTRFLPIP